MHARHRLLMVLAMWESRSATALVWVRVKKEVSSMSSGGLYTKHKVRAKSSPGLLVKFLRQNQIL